MAINLKPEGKTLADEVKTSLINKGLFPTQIDDVFPLIVNNEAMAEFKYRWNDKTSDYGPAPIVATMMMVVDPIVLKYIDDTCPQAWFRPMFLSGSERTKFIEDNFTEKQLPR